MPEQATGTVQDGHQDGDELYVSKRGERFVIVPDQRRLAPPFWGAIGFLADDPKHPTAVSGYGSTRAEAIEDAKRWIDHRP